MPIYTYKCKKCGKVFEWTQSIKCKPLEYCPEEICEEETYGKGEVERVISKNIGLIFKGSGFYLTDYSKKNSSTSPASSTSVQSGNETNSPKSEDTNSGNTSSNSSKSDSVPTESTAKVNSKNE